MAIYFEVHFQAYLSKHLTTWSRSSPLYHPSSWRSSPEEGAAQVSCEGPHSVAPAASGLAESPSLSGVPRHESNHVALSGPAREETYIFNSIVILFEYVYGPSARHSVRTRFGQHTSTSWNVKFIMRVSVRDEKMPVSWWSKDFMDSHTNRPC